MKKPKKTDEKEAEKDFDKLADRVAVKVAEKVAVKVDENKTEDKKEEKENGYRIKIGPNYFEDPTRFRVMEHTFSEENANNCVIL